MAGVEGKDRGIHKEDKTGGSWSEKNKISHFIPVWTAASCSCGSGSEVDKDTKINGESGKGETYETDSMADYEKYLEQKTAQTLGVVDGAGKVTVMITLKSTGQKVVEKDQQSTHQTTKEAGNQGETRESEEKSLDKTSQGTDGTQIPYVSKENAPEVEGILVIADGGGNAVVAKNLTEAVQALFGVEAHKIKIMKRAPT